MKTDRIHIPQEFYSNLGFLFYSVAASDRHVAPAETERLRAEMKAHWIPLEPAHDDIGTVLAEYMDISFDYAVGEGMSAHEAFDRFKEYYDSEPDTFDASTKALVLRTARAIAASRSGINKSEHGALARLVLLFRDRTDGYPSTR